jgi:hypothetical protein
VSADVLRRRETEFGDRHHEVQLEKLREELEQGREQAERDREAFKHELEKAEQERERFKLELPKIAAETGRLEREDRYYPWLQLLTSGAVAAAVAALVAHWR